ncbi:MAG: hypothetical protein K8R53_09285 [Bacteroidales bacterium]|nr:hypothetical protein [Bacteroidales bacterium]
MNSGKYTFILTILIVFPSLFATAQPLPYDLAVGGGELNNPVGGGAGLGNGLLMMVTLGIGYGIIRYKQIKKKLMD